MKRNEKNLRNQILRSLYNGNDIRINNDKLDVFWKGKLISLNITEEKFNNILNNLSEDELIVYKNYITYNGFFMKMSISKEICISNLGKLYIERLY